MKESLYFDNNGTKVHYEKEGHGAPILCISGFGCSNYNFEYLRSELSKNFCLIMLDNRGMGKSDPAVIDYKLKDLADDAHSLMLELGFNKYNVIGISMGGFIAQELALKSPESILSLVLACTTSSGPDFQVLNKLDEDSIRKSFALDKEVYNLLVVRATVHPEIENNEPDLFKKILDLRIKNTPKVEQVLFQKNAVDEFFNSEINLSKITCPTLILSGKEDRFVLPSNSIILSEKIPNTKLKFIENSDHHFFLERPVIASKIITEYLGETL